MFARSRQVGKNLKNAFTISDHLQNASLLQQLFLRNYPYRSKNAIKEKKEMSTVRKEYQRWKWKRKSLVTAGKTWQLNETFLRKQLLGRYNNCFYVNARMWEENKTTIQVIIL